MRTRGHRWNPAGWMQRSLSPRGGGGGGGGRGGSQFDMLNHVQQAGPKTSSTWKIMGHPACHQFIAKANPTPASKLASGIDQKTLTTLERALSWIEFEVQWAQSKQVEAIWSILARLSLSKKPGASHLIRACSQSTNTSAKPSQSHSHSVLGFAPKIFEWLLLADTRTNSNVHVLQLTVHVPTLTARTFNILSD